jgi:hypothetical protein
MKLLHALCALHSDRHASRVVNGLEDMTWRSTVSYPSTPQNLPAFGDGAGVDEIVVMDEISIDDAEVLVSVELTSADGVLETKVTLLELELLEL